MQSHYHNWSLSFSFFCNNFLIFFLQCIKCYVWSCYRYLLRADFQQANLVFCMTLTTIVQWYTIRSTTKNTIRIPFTITMLNTTRILLILRSQSTIQHHSSTTSEIPFNLIIIFWTLICIITNGRYLHN